MSTSQSTNLKSVPQEDPSESSHREEVRANETQVEIDGDDEVNGKRKLTSKVWNEFKRERKDGVMTAVCNKCNKRLSAAASNGTTHLRNHLLSCTRRRFGDVRQMLKGSITSTGGSDLVLHKFNQDKSREALAKMVILHEYPLSMVEHQGFHNFLNVCQPLVKLPSRNTLKSDIMKIYDNEKGKTMTLLENMKGKIALTTDMWTANHQRKGFMAITAHYVNDSWSLESRIIRYVIITTYLFFSSFTF